MTAEGPILVLGAGGMLGRAVLAEAEGRGLAVTGHDREACDVTDPEAVAGAIAAAGPSVLVNCAAWTDVDGAEADEAGAARVNAAAPRVLAEACRDHGVRLVHVSTDYVFAGDGTAPYPVDAPIEPLNAYGRTKAAGERAIREVLGEEGDWVIARTAWLYDGTSRNFLTTIARLAADRDRIEVVDDQRGRPTAAAELARQLLELVARPGARGTFHCCNDGEATWHDFAVAIVRGLGLDCRVDACGSDRFPRPAARPAYSVLDLSRTEATIGPIPRWEDSLAAVLDHRPAAAS